MENEQFSAVFEWVFFLGICRNSKQKQQCHWWPERDGERVLLRGEFTKFSESKKKISIELILNAALSAACLLPHWKVRACSPGGREGDGAGQAGWLQFYKASVWPRLALIDFCVDICALGYRSRRSLPPFACLGTCLARQEGCPAPFQSLPLLPPTRLRTVCCVCDATINALCCH